MSAKQSYTCFANLCGNCGGFSSEKPCACKCHRITSGPDFNLWSEREEAAPDRALGLHELQEHNRNCEHVVVVGQAGGPASLAVKMRGQDVCPHCTRREAAYWRTRAKSAEGMLNATNAPQAEP